MLQEHRLCGSRCFLMAVAAVAVALAVAGPAQGQTADLDKIDSAIKQIPADAAFFNTMLRNREQIEAIGKSKAWARLMALPAVQDLRKMADSELGKPGSPLAQFRAFFEQPENRQLLEVLGDMVSHEVYIYGGENFADFMALLADINGAVQFGPLQAILTEGPAAANRPDTQIIAVLQALDANRERLKPPDLIIGFKLTKPDAAEAQLKRLEELLQGVLAQTPQLKGRLKREKVAGGEFLTFTLDGSMVPWQEIPFKRFEEKPGQFDALQKSLRQMKLTISFGIRDGYLLLSIGESNKQLTRLGQGKRLIDRPEFKPLGKFAKERLTSISYTSQAFNAKIATGKEDIDGLVEFAKGALTKANLTADQRKRIDKDLDDLATGLKSGITEPGASLGFAFLTKRGQESYSYALDSAARAGTVKPLTLLNHVGGSPILACVGRGMPTPEQYKGFIKWVKKAYGYVEEFALPHMPPGERDKYEQIMKIAQPFLARADKVTAEMLLPALADGQIAFVLDAKLTSKQWHPAMPAGNKPLPILEPAFVFGVSDAPLLEKAFGEYRGITNEFLTQLNKLAPNEVPQLQIPPPQSRKAKAGTLYFYPLPAQLGLDKRIIPTAGVAPSVASLTISHEHAERLLTRTPLKVDGGPLAKTDRPLLSAVYFDWAGFVDALTPWVDYGFDQAGKSGQDLDSIAKQVRTVAEVLKCLRTVTSVTYIEGNAVVTHSEVVIRDVE